METTTQEKRVDIKLIFHVAVTVLLMFFFRFIPAPTPITPYGMQILGIFLGIVYAWTFSTLVWPSLLAMAALGLTDFGTTADVYAAAFGNENLILMLMGFIMFGPILQSGLSDWLGMKLLSLRMIKGKPWVLLIVVFAGCTVLSTMINATILMIFMLALFTDIFKKLGYQKGDRFVAMFIIGIMIAVSTGISIFPFKSWPLAPLGVSKKAGMFIDDGKYMLVVFTTIVAIIAFYILLMKVLKCNVKPLAEVDFAKLDKDGKLAKGLSKHQKALLYVVIINLIACVSVSLLAGAEGWHLALSKYGVYGVFVTIMAGMIVIQVEGKPLLDVTSAAKSISWDMMFLYAIAMLVSNCLTTEGTGIAPFVMQVLLPILNGTGEYLFLVLLAVLTLFLTNVGNNLVVTFTMLSIVTMMMQQGIQFNSQVAVIMITVLGLMGYVLPASSIYGAMTHSNELTTSKSAMFAGLVACLVVVIVVAAIMIPLGMLLF